MSKETLPCIFGKVLAITGMVFPCFWWGSRSTALFSRATPYTISGVDLIKTKQHLIGNRPEWAFFPKVREIILIFIEMRWQSNMTTEDNCNQSSIETEVTAASRGHKFAHFYEAEISLAWLLISSWALCHLFRPLHEYRAVLLLKLQNYNRMTKIRPAVCLNLESAYHPSQAKIKILGVIVFVISIAHVRQSA